MLPVRKMAQCSKLKQLLPHLENVIMTMDSKPYRTKSVTLATPDPHSSSFPCTVEPSEYAAINDKEEWCTVLAFAIRFSWSSLGHWISKHVVPNLYTPTCLEDTDIFGWHTINDCFEFLEKYDRAIVTDQHIPDMFSRYVKHVQLLLPTLPTHPLSKDKPLIRNIKPFLPSTAAWQKFAIIFGK